MIFVIFAVAYGAVINGDCDEVLLATGMSARLAFELQWWEWWACLSLGTMAVYAGTGVSRSR